MSQSKSVVVVYTGRLEDEKGAAVGVKGVGKDTSARLLAKLAPQYDHVFLSFADALKDAVAEYWGLDRAHYDTPEHKEEPIDAYPGWTWRRLLEVFGTDVARKLQDSVWVEKVTDRILLEVGAPEELLAHRAFGQTMEDAGMEESTYESGMIRPMEMRGLMTRLMEMASLPKTRNVRRPRMFHVTDCRFLNEYRALNELAPRVRVEVLQVRRKAGGPVQQGAAHASNTFDEAMVPHYIVCNDGTLEELEACLGRFLATLSETPVETVAFE